MIRAQVRLNAEEHEAAKAEAERLGISLSELLRRALRSALGLSPPWMRYAGTVESGDPTSSRGIDDVVYGHDE